MTEQQNTPELRFPGFNGEWRFNKLGDLTTKIGSGKTPKGGSQNYLNAGIPFLRSQNIQNGKLNLDDLVYIDSKTDETMKNSKSYFGDILLNITGASIGRSAINSIDNTHINLNQHVCIIRLKKQFSYKFLGNFLLSPRGQKKIFKAQSGGSREGLNFKEIANINLYIPDNFNEQEKLGKFFSKLDRQIELEEKKLELLEQQKRGYMQKIFSQELRFKDESGNDYPEWKERKFSELLSYSSNGVDKKINKNHDIAYMVNYMDVFKKTKLNTKNRDLLMETTATKIQKEKNNLKKGDILFTPSSETREDIAKSTVVFEDLDNTVYSYHLIRLRPLDSNIFSLKYSNYLSEQNFISKQFRRLAQGAQRYTLTKEHFENIRLNLPHITEQEKIGDFFSKLDEVINKQSQKIDELKLRKQGFLQKMFV
ncbi:restriction modification system DNA specificity subunit [Mycobacteroides abscessus subsp. abscessus]|nr:restriction modification system DNA specificity subunit [Mycobacteroides abscessus subsp. abscessus]